MLPEISVILTTYNQEKFIEKAIDSILNQSFNNFELIIVDDGSIDNTRRKIDQYSDSRIKKVFKQNEGPSSASNVGITLAEGKWIALMSGDDISLPERLQVQYEFVNSFSYKICFGLPTIIDGEGNIIPDEDFPVFFTKQPCLKGEVFKRLFEKGNYFCAPTAFFQKDILEEKDPFLLPSLQLQDFVCWLNLSKKYDMPIINKRLIKYRRHSNNISSKNNDGRVAFEMRMIYENILDNMSWGQLHEIFPNHFSVASMNDKSCFEIEKAFLLMKQSMKSIHEVGCEKIWDYLNDDAMRQILSIRYNFSCLDFFMETGKFNITEENEKND